MSTTNKPSKQTIAIHNALKKAVKDNLDKKQKLGQYIVVWDGEKPVMQPAKTDIENSAQH